MSGRIPEQFIQTLLNRIDIAEVIGERLPLKAAGTGLFKAKCPFHNEKTPSFTVSIQRQTYHCFGCGAHGSVIRFLMEYDHLDFPEVIEDLARRIGEPVPRENHHSFQNTPHQKTQLEDYDLLEKVAQHFAHWLKHHPDATVAVGYLKQRGLSGEIARRYGVGFAPPGWDSLRATLGASHRDALIRNGLLVENEQGNVYDRFRYRIMFPIRDRRGRVIGFGGRVIDDQQPKYLNSPETPIFTKGRELYGLYESLQTQRHPEFLLVVEGYMDVIALAQAGISGAVATLGTAITSHHIERLFKTTQRVVFCFDGDTAGRDAAWKALNVSLSAIRGDQQIQFLFLPDGEDPDTQVRRLGTEKFTTLIAQSTPLSSYVFDQLGESLNLSTLDGLSSLIERSRPLLNKMAPSALRFAMIGELARLTRYKFGQADELEKHMVDPTTNPLPTQRADISRQRTPVRLAIALLLNHPKLAQLVDMPERWKSLPVPGADLLARLITHLQAHPNHTTAILLETWPNTSELAIFKKLVTWDHLVPDAGATDEFRGIISRFGQMLTDQEIHSLEDQMRQGTLSTEDAERWKVLIARKSLPYT